MEKCKKCGAVFTESKKQCPLCGPVEVKKEAVKIKTKGRK